MGIYEKLVQLANAPCDQIDNLTDLSGEKITSSIQVIESLKDEFISDSFIASLSIDNRQACETLVSEN